VSKESQSLGNVNACRLPDWLYIPLLYEIQ